MTDQRARSLVARFEKEFGSRPKLVESPGRVNLIGEHTDYNEGFALPAAIDLSLLLAIAPNNKRRIRLVAADMEKERFEAPLSASPDKSGIGWPDYVLGCVEQLFLADREPGGFDCLFSGNIPIGAGLSSSAALATGALTGLSHLFDLHLPKLEIVRMAQAAENLFVGTACGIMDQYANMFGKEGCVIRLDCRSLEHEYFPFGREDLRILLCDSGVHRELATSEYNLRRTQCEEGVKRLAGESPGLRSLRDVSEELLHLHRGILDQTLFNRCLFVVEENRRVLMACEDLKRADAESFGERMNASHRGLRDLYEVSCRELDLLAETAWGLEGVLGARMMGGGFGGCTINLVCADRLDAVRMALGERYRIETGRTLRTWTTRTGPGTRLLPQES